MNILFYTPSRATSLEGGTERITFRVAEGLRMRGHHCYAVYSWGDEPKEAQTLFVEEVKLPETELADYAISHAIDVVIVQMLTRSVRLLRRKLQEQGREVKIVSVLHFNPGYQEQRQGFGVALSEWKFARGLKGHIVALLRLVLYPLYHLVYPRRNRELYRVVYRYSDLVVVLARGFIDEYMCYAHLKESNKLCAIPNMLSYNDFLPEDRLKAKEHRVLVVSRMDEAQKRISLILRLWQQVEADAELRDWQLDIVGEGADLPRYLDFADRLGLQRVVFHGYKEPRPFYERSSLFLMTSAFEGWGLTLTEAQQFGCVPLALDTYIALHDIITPLVDGFIIPEGRMDLYFSTLRRLMLHEDERQACARRAIASARRFEMENIVSKWELVISPTPTLPRREGVPKANKGII